MCDMRGRRLTARAIENLSVVVWLACIALVMSNVVGRSQVAPVQLEQDFVPLRRDDLGQLRMTVQSIDGGPVSRLPVTDLYVVLRAENGGSIDEFLDRPNNADGAMAVGTLYAVASGRLMITWVNCRQWERDRVSCNVDCDGGGIELSRARGARRRLEFGLSQGVSFQSICGGDNVSASMIPANSRIATMTLRPRSEPPDASTTGATCVVRDPTGTPLNVRQSPGGAVQFSLANGTRIIAEKSWRDGRNREWVYISSQVGQGWVFRAHIRCDG